MEARIIFHTTNLKCAGDYKGLYLMIKIEQLNPIDTKFSLDEASGSHPGNKNIEHSDVFPSKFD